MSAHFPSTRRVQPDPNQADADGRLIVVSNRVALPGATQTGGMAQALRVLLAERGGCWLGWSGEVSARTDLHEHQDGAVCYQTWDLSRAEFQGYYREFANRTLWPLLHGRTDLMDYDTESLRTYLDVNRRFAERVAATASSEDTIWVHDYHLIPLASMLRAKGLCGRIGFFLHTPLPPSRTLTALPRHRELLGLLTNYDLIGVQTEADAAALRQYLVSECGTRHDGEAVVSADGHPIQVRAFPIGVDPAELAQLATSAADREGVSNLRESLGRRHLVIGVDRLDYSKGLPQRLRAFGQMLDRFPEWHDRATLLQISPESRRDVGEYRQLSREVQRLVGDINGHHAAPAWTPVRYLNRSFAHEELSGFYRAARVGLVTPLRDGMNLVAKEFIACQPEEDPGVLVLSEFAGAAQELRDVALLVNPFDIEGCGATIAQALAMPVDERRSRWQRGMRRLERGNVHRWGRDFLDRLRNQDGRSYDMTLDARHRVVSLSAHRASHGLATLGR